MNALTKTEGGALALAVGELCLAVTYDPAIGTFRRIVASSWAKAGDLAGCQNARGYVEFNVLGRLHRAHRLAWLYVHGEWPAGHIDHIDGNRSNNAIANLRVVSNRTNGENRRQANRNNATRMLGTRLHKKSGKFEARIGVAGQLVYLGLHETAELAHAAYVTAKRIYHQGSTL